MQNRFRNDISRVPAVRIGVARGGLTTTIGWDGAGWSPSGAAPSLRGPMTIGDPRLAGPLPTDRFLIPGTRRDFGGGNVSQMTSAGLESFKALLLGAQARKREIVADMRKARLQLAWAWTVRAISWATLVPAAVGPLRRSAQKGVAIRRQEISTLAANLKATPVKVDFDMDSEVGGPQRRMQEAFDRIAASQRTWVLDSSQHIDRVRARSAAGVVVSRRLAALGRKADPLVDTSEPPLALAVQGGLATAYFYPGFVLVAARDGGDFALVDIKDLDVKWSATQFTESETVPGDAQVIGHAWAKSNKDGSRDKRFAHNRQIPVARYGEVTLRSSGGLDESLMVSQVEPCEAFAAAVRDLKQILVSAQTSLKAAGRRAIAQGN